MFVSIDVSEWNWVVKAREWSLWHSSSQGHMDKAGIFTYENDLFLSAFFKSLHRVIFLVFLSNIMGIWPSDKFDNPYLTIR